MLGISLIFKTINNDSDQNKINKTSVDNKKDEKETPGITKKDTAVIVARSLFAISFLEIKCEDRKSQKKGPSPEKREVV